MSEDFQIDRMINLIEINCGNLKPTSIAIIDKNFKIWGLKGEFPEKAVTLFENYSIDELKPGDSLHNENSFLMKITEKTGVIISMYDEKLSILASANLRGRINALSDFYLLEKLIEKP
ncbi:MAG: hypothetical protein ACUVXA_19730 [Candidatus Jordarchaeum sp.]|uniref:hypothetical protein n=1 Tax=Candidatus Jordarchaeum sp. TaxID=2823881 RepID=UPI00404A187E